MNASNRDGWQQQQQPPPPPPNSNAASGQQHNSPQSQAQQPQPPPQPQQTGASGLPAGMSVPPSTGALFTEHSALSASRFTDQNRFHSPSNYHNHNYHLLFLLLFQSALVTQSPWPCWFNTKLSTPACAEPTAPASPLHRVGTSTSATAIKLPLTKYGSASVTSTSNG